MIEVRALDVSRGAPRNRPDIGCQLLRIALPHAFITFAKTFSELNR
jgi:hypothetical protein